MHLLVRRAGVVEVRLGASSRSQFVQAKEIGDLWRFNVAKDPQLIAAVKIDPDVAYGRMIDVLDQLQKVGAKRVSLQLMPPVAR